ncbi:hypothetical protein EV356DRAFT_503840 [Viridothelium virens]|uniref:NGG1p interacting factor 3 n=1 Tax=Viridothelium virens TaxID=1048519 RepID=A0A6A6H5W9_VIRVR|nr:hypothetical protein EV356DRAFT_503840 [Viridothelium virens]
MQARPSSHYPTHTQISSFLSGFLSPTSHDLPFHYHHPLHPLYNPSNNPVRHLVLALHPSITTYHLLSQPHTAAFLHRPFSLNRRRIRRGNLVLASHTAFDAALTVGYNIHLASHLGLDVERGESRCVQGYKGDAERKIGIVGLLDRPESVVVMLGRVRGEFGGEGELFLPPVSGRNVVADAKIEAETAVVDQQAQGLSDRQIKVLAIMNAFHAEEVRRVIDVSVEARWTAAESAGKEILYLTGAARPYGLEAAAAHDMSAFCVGHLACEKWGIRFLADRMREEFPGLDVQEIYEEEEIK